MLKIAALTVGQHWNNIRPNWQRARVNREVANDERGDNGSRLGFKGPEDRLIVFGIFEILLGALFALMVLVMTFGMVASAVLHSPSPVQG